MNHPLKKEILILLLCLLIGFALRFYTFDQKSLWMDEIYTFNDSRDDLKGQIKFYKDNPTFLHPPLFFILTNIFYPFNKPERDLRIIPLIFGTLSISMIYFLARQFSSAIALPCTISLTFMTYHINLSQEGRSYAFLLFLGMVGLTCLMRYLRTSRSWLLIGAGAFYALLFHTSYSSIPFIVLSQIVWFYQTEDNQKFPRYISILIFNGLILLFCLPWLIFLGLNYNGQSFMIPYQSKEVIFFWNILYGIFHDWTPYLPLTTTTILLFLFFPLFHSNKRNAFILIAAFLLPIIGLYFYCKAFNITHFISSRYFIAFLPFLLITLYLSIQSFEEAIPPLKRFFRLKIIFIVLFIASNFIILPLYYRSEKQDIRGLVNYLKGHLNEGDKIFDVNLIHTPGILHYFGVIPERRHYQIPYYNVSESEIEYRTIFPYQAGFYTIYFSRDCCSRYVADGNRLWIVGGKRTVQKLKGNSPAVLKGYFDGSFLNFNRFPTDASIYLFLWDPKSPDEKEIDIPIE